MSVLGDRSQGFWWGAGGPVGDPTPRSREGGLPLVADGTYLGPVKGGRPVDDRAVNASA
jgi:hypothetical protein